MTGGRLAEPPIAFSLRLETTEGTVVLPVDLDPNGLDADQLSWIKERIPSFPPDRLSLHIAAAIAFVRMGRPDDDWDVIAPVLMDALDPKGSLDSIEIR